MVAPRLNGCTGTNLAMVPQSPRDREGLPQRALTHPKPPELRDATRERLAAVDEYHLHQSLVTYLAKHPPPISH